MHDNPDALTSNTTTFQRDPMGRLLEKHSPDGEVSHFAYNKNGQLAQAANDNNDVRFEYTPTGQLSKESQNKQEITHTYNPQGKRVSTTLPNKKTIAYDYDNNQQWSNISFDGENVSTLERNAWGQETQRTQGTLNTHTDYDIMGRLTQQRVTGQQSKQQIIQRQYQYNDAGNLSVIDDFRKGVTEYQYDSLDRLKTANGYAQEQFAFDPAGNLLDTATNDTNTSSQIKGNRLQFQGDRKFEYDNAGNLVKENRGKGGKLVTTYRYNKQNQLVSINNGKQATRYSYDALGRRITKEDAFGTTLFLWNGDVLLSETRNHSEKLYLYEPESFRPLAQIQNGQVYHYHLDQLGTPQEMTNHKGGIVWSAQYKAYGNLALNDVDYIENNLRFQGQYFDEESGLHYNRHRYYDPNTARFTSADPIGLAGGENNYQYAHNPIHWIDPFGLAAKIGDCPSARSKYLKEKYSGMSSETRRAMIDFKTERLAHDRLKNLEDSIPKSHFLTSHGAQTSPAQQLLRATKGNNPNPHGANYKTDATRFTKHKDQWTAIERAKRILENTGDLSKAQKPIDFGRKVGDGYAKKTGVQKAVQKAVVRFDAKTGKPYTAFPKYKD